MLRRCFLYKIITRTYAGNSRRITEDIVRDRILDPDNKQKLLKRLSKVKHGLKLQPNAKDAGVLVPLCITNGQLSLLYTQRTPWLSTHAGQVSFPGGLIDENDNTPIDAAIRETEEELGLDGCMIDVWINMGVVPDRRGKFKVNAVLGYLGNVNVKKLKINKQEVQEVFTVPLTQLLMPENQRYTMFRNGWKMPVITNSGHNIWGMTAIFTDVFLANAFPDFYQLIVSRYDGDLAQKYL